MKKDFTLSCRRQETSGETNQKSKPAPSIGEPRSIKVDTREACPDALVGELKIVSNQNRENKKQ